MKHIFLYLIPTIIFFTIPNIVYANLGTITAPGSFNQDIANADQAGVTNRLNSLITIIIGVLTTIAAIYFMLQIFISGYKWLSAGGDSGQITTARDNLIQSIIGLAIVVAAYAISGLIASILGIDIFNPLGFLTTYTTIIVLP